MRIHNLATQSAMKPFEAASGAANLATESGNDFANTLMDALKEVNTSQQQSREMQNQFMAGQPVDFHDLMIQMEQASTAMQLTMQVRNKLLEGYQEISRMQV
jgi:flagellar hook-basal body complex protein FliE